jgi:hypothetical protein
MKNTFLKVLTVTCLWLVAVASLHGQHLSSKTNEVSVKKSATAELLNTGILPRITWIHPQLDLASSEANKMDLHVQVQLQSAVKEIKLAVASTEGDVVLVSKKIPLQPGQLVYDIKVPVTLPNGSNYVNLQVTTLNDVVVSERRGLLIGAGALDNVLSLDRKDYALLFCTDKYDHWTDLVNPVDDAHAIAKELSEKYGFIVEIVENPLLEDVWTKLREYNEKKFSPQDQLLVFFAGHGQYDETFGEGYVVAKNSLSNDPSKNTYLSHNRLRGVIDNIPCSHILLTMDVCFGGTLDPVIARSRGQKENEASTNEILARKWSHKTRKYLTSGGKEYVSDGIPGKHSPFAEKLIESFKTLGGDDNLLTLSELQSVLEKLKQLPRFGSFGSDEKQGDFVFVRKR